MVILLLIIMLFSVLSIILLQGRGAMLIAGYNTSSLEDRAKIDEVKLCKDMGKMMLGITFSLLFYVPGGLYDKEIYFIFGTVLMFLSIIIGLIFMNSKNRYTK